jgi:FAD/FMN-containing dehydrogenase/ferredoxin
MHAGESTSGRAIYGGSGAPSDQRGFCAKYERDGASPEVLARSSLEEGRIITARGEMSLYSRDQSEIPWLLKQVMFRSSPDAVAQPRSSDEVASVLKRASELGIPVVPRGSGSSPFGGSVPVVGGIVVDISRMDRVLGLDEATGVVTVQAGIRWADVDRYLERHGLALRTCPSSRFSTVGGWVATGGYGLNSLSGGHLSESVHSLELATADGKVMWLGREDPHFPQVFGSEGQLGVVTAVKLATRSRPANPRPHLIMFSDIGSALSFAKGLLGSEVRPTHMFLENSARILTSNRLLHRNLFKNADAVLLNIEDPESERLFQSFVKAQGVQEEQEYLARYLWNERYFPMKIHGLGPGMLGTELLVPVDRLQDITWRAGVLSSALAIEPFFEIHFLKGGDALLLCFFLTDKTDMGSYTLDALKSMLLTRALLDAGGRLYSVGIWNNPFHGEGGDFRSGRMRATKSSLDPKGVMNPGKYFSLSGRLGGLGALAFSPKLMNPLLKALLVLAPLTGRALGLASTVLRGLSGESEGSRLLKAADECAMCGACVSVCPAYLILGDERVTARGKLLTAKAVVGGERISKEHAHRTFLCMRCKACEQVCQSKLDLLPAYEELEARLEKMYGRDPAEIEQFVKFAESSPEYDEMVERGLVLGAPRHGMGGGRSDV